MTDPLLFDDLFIDAAAQRAAEERARERAKESELQHVIERAVLLSRGRTLRLEGVLAEPNDTTHAKLSLPPRDAPHAVIRESEWRRRERENLRTALQLAEGRVYGPDGAADIVGVKPTTLISRLKALGLRDQGTHRRPRQNRS